MIKSEVYIRSGALISALGPNISTAEMHLEGTHSGIVHASNPFPDFSNFPLGYIKDLSGNNRFDALYEKLLQDLRKNESEILGSPDTIVLLSSAKGNIERLPDNPFGGLHQKLMADLKLVNTPLIISNACISGILAINLAADLIKSGKYQNAVVIGIDVLSEFVISGFNSLFALSQEVCKPYDKARTGINLGESACYVVVSGAVQGSAFHVKYLGGSSSNDANHISGPSRTGEGLYRSVQKTLHQAGLSVKDIDLINAHGTATMYNDEMESIAFDRLGLTDTPVNSFKGYLGHTLGAAGVAETILAMVSMEKGRAYASAGYEESGVSKPIKVIKNVQDVELNVLLKTGSGFGGGNASLLIEKTGR